jgi:hypothetical protein
MRKTTVLTWLWKQKNSRFLYSAEHVNTWAEQILRNTTLPIELACVTDMPEGIDGSIRIIPIPEDNFEEIKVANWNENKGFPQCFRRISMFSPHAADIFGERFVCMDLDMIVTKNIDHVIGFNSDFKIMRGTNIGKRPYNGGLIAMEAGSRPQVFNKFSYEGARRACKLYVGSDQAWISYCLGWCEDVFNFENDGVAFLFRNKIRELMNNSVDLSRMTMGFFPGEPKFFHSGDVFKAYAEEVRFMNELFDQDVWDEDEATVVNPPYEQLSKGNGKCAVPRIQVETLGTLQHKNIVNGDLYLVFQN